MCVNARERATFLLVVQMLALNSKMRWIPAISLPTRAIAPISTSAFVPMATGRRTVRHVRPVFAGMRKLWYAAIWQTQR
jgi:hypothetical protein